MTIDVTEQRKMPVRGVDCPNLQLSRLGKLLRANEDWNAEPFDYDRSSARPFVVEDENTTFYVLWVETPDGPEIWARQTTA
jgi:hypothetical protein